MRRVTLAALAFMAATAPERAADAQVAEAVCFHPPQPAASVHAYLGQKYAESLKASRVGAAGEELELWANDQTGTWTIVRRFGPLACATASGLGWKPSKEL